MTRKRFTLDTSILVCSVDRHAGARQPQAAEVIERAAGRDCRLTLQAVSGFHAAVTRKGIVRAREAAGHAAYWDSLLVARAEEAGCAAVLTEDLADGGALFGVRIVSAFGMEGVAAAALEVLGGDGRGARRAGCAG